jgi:hypothetical protein
MNPFYCMTIPAGSFTASKIKALRWQLDLNPCTDAQGIFWRLATRATAILAIPDRAKESRPEHDQLNEAAANWKTALALPAPANDASLGRRQRRDVA